MSLVRNIFILGFSFFSLAAYSISSEEKMIENEVHDFKGSHLVASYGGCNTEALSDVAKLEAAMLQAVKASGATVLDSVKYVFPPNGLTMVILLSESHASIHTYPEYNACFVDLFTCGPNCNNENFDKALREYLQPTDVHSKILVRHHQTEELK